MKTGKSMLSVLSGEKPERRPIWLMRQAGRYLPEYKAVRAKAGSFLNLCLDPEMAAEVTLQPLRRFDMDAAILFADILLVPYALGASLEFQEGEGPVLAPVRNMADLGRLKWHWEKVAPVFETLRIVKSSLAYATTLIGFSGAPWTVACYMIEGRGKTGFGKALEFAKSGDADFLASFFDILHNATLDYLSRQIEAGAEVIQLFDSWAGLLDDAGFRNFCIEPTRKLVSALKLKYPSVPIIGFPRGARPENYRRYVTETGVDALGIDEKITLNFARDELQTVKPVQGNLAPELLVEGGEAMRRGVEDIMRTLGKNHIFNLGHGVPQTTPLENVEELIKIIREIEKGNL
jgi:uroporphyrinogen decarboxylase